MARDNQKGSSGSQPDVTTQPVVELLTSILNDVQRQVQSRTLEPPKGEEPPAVVLFRRIGAMLAIKPTVTLKAGLVTYGIAGCNVTLTWSSTEAQTVKIGKEVVTPAAGGSKEFWFKEATNFVATATGLCGEAKAEVSVECKM